MDGSIATSYNFKLIIIQFSKIVHTFSTCLHTPLWLKQNFLLLWTSN